MGTGIEIALIASAVIGAVGAGVSAYGQVQQGKAQNAIAQFNAQQQEKQAQMQLLGMQTQAAMQKQQADANFALRSAEANARMNNADLMASQSLQQDAINRLNLRKRREEFGRMQGAQRAAIAASGVSEASGTPLDILLDTTAKIQQDQEEQHYVNEVQRRTLFNEEAMERLGGKLALAGATLNRDSEIAAAALRGTAAHGEYLGDLRAAEITRLTGRAAQTASYYQAGATLLSQGSKNAGTISQVDFTTS
jgi:hypothetical protein